MKAGGRRRLIVPSGLAYGSGALIFVIDLLGINEEPSRVGRPKPKIAAPKGPPPKKVLVNDIDEGSGPVLKRGDEMAVDYVGVNYKTGREFESTWERSEPAKFTFGTGEVIKGWELGLKGMRVGGRRELIVPSRFAYETGTLIYVIDLIGVE